MAKGAAAMKASVRASSRWVTFFSTSSRGVSYSARSWSRVVTAKGSAAGFASMGREPGPAPGRRRKAPGGAGRRRAAISPVLVRNLNLPEPCHGGPFARQEHHAPQGAQDAKRAKAFAKLIREITVSAKRACPTRRSTRGCAPR